MVAVTVWVAPGAIDAMLVGANAVVQPLGGVAEMATSCSGVVPVLVTTSETVPVEPAVTWVLRTWLGVPMVTDGLPVTSASRFAVAVWPPPATVTCSGYAPAGVEEIGRA